jgi:hypothetical protein
LNLDSLENTGGLFKTGNVDIINHTNQEVNPIYFKISLSKELQIELSKHQVEGYFIVRTKRTPSNLFQGLSMGVDKNSGFIAPYIYENGATKYVIESFINKNKILSDVFDEHLYSGFNVEYSALISLDAMVKPDIQSLLS